VHPTSELTISHSSVLDVFEKDFPDLQFLDVPRSRDQGTTIPCWIKLGYHAARRPKISLSALSEILSMILSIP
jgi:hypothetical protein